MPFIRSFSILTDRKHPFPYNIAAVQFAQNIQLSEKVTILVGDNGCGKSTLLETLALGLRLPLIGGSAGNKAGFEAAGILQPYLKIEWKRETRKGFFFRAEDFSDFISSPDNERNKLRYELRELEGKVDDAIIRQLSDSMNYSLRNTKKHYGDDMQAYSHGEAYLKILQIRIGNKGIYLLDEPEAALSPLKQLSLLFLIAEIVKNENSQFIISTHSPVMMGFPDALIYEIKEEGMQQVKYEETDHYRITKRFLTDPGYYLRHME